MANTLKLLLPIILLSIGLYSCSDDEQSIKITVSDFEAIIDENPLAGTVLGTLEANTSKGTLTFALTNATLLDGAFAIDEITGELSVVNTNAFDFEETDEVTGTAIITSGQESKEVNIRISLNNLIEISVSNFSASIAENPSNGQILGNLSASTTNEGALVYTLLVENPAGALAIQPTGNVIVLDKNFFNFEQRTQITATVTAASNYSTDFKNATITITLTDVTETVQQRLTDGETPKQIYDKDNTLLNQLYAKNYAGGIIGSFNTSSGSCMILSGNQGGSYTASAAITAANNLSLNGYDDWRLPTNDEAQSLNTALSTGINVLPTGGSYWTSTGCGGICVHSFYIGSSALGGGGEPSSNLNALMAIRIQN